MSDKKQTIEIESGEKKKIVLASETLPSTLPIFPIHHRPPLPKLMAPMLIDDEKLKELAINISKSSSKHLGLVLVKKEKFEKKDDSPIKPEDLHSFGAAVIILQVASSEPKLPLQIMLLVQERFKIVKIVQEEPYMVAEVKYFPETEMSMNNELKAFAGAIIASLKELIKLHPLFKEELKLFLGRSTISEPGKLADFAASFTTGEAEELQEVLEAVNIRSRIKKVLLLLKKEIEITKIQTKISKQIEKKISKTQREFFLREQLKAIKKELGLTKEGKDTEIEKFQERIKKLTLSEEVKVRIDEELNKLSLIEPASPEYNVSRNYLDWLTSLPWGIFSKDNFDIKRAAAVLERDHYGLSDVKERILEFISVGKMKGNISGSIICFVGPPGVGKTSIGHSIAESIGREFFRFSLGGMRDEAEIKGHRRTYIGAMPGKFIQTMKTVKTANPVIMLDEIDKIGSSFQGDPASALLEVLDPEQNVNFSDHFLDVPFDLSNVLFISTANQTDTIPPPLLDRMEIIKLSGYILEEKLQIGKKFLFPKQLKAHGLKKKNLSLSSRSLRNIIDGYAREAGVRGLENQIKKIMRKTAKKLAEGDKTKVTITPENLGEYLGKKIFVNERLYKKSIPGVVMGLAWTRLGGETLYIEAGRVEAEKPGFKQTGQLGNVMVESSEIAHTLVRSLLAKDSRHKNFFEKNFVHIHVPAGATPKDGPSAGITMALALYSLATNKPVKKNIAMTGELSLNGLVMPIGGLKEKTIAAKRAKVANLIFPKDNEKDFEELPDYIKKGLNVNFVSHFQEVIDICLE